MRKLNGHPIVSPLKLFSDVSNYLAENPLEHDRYGNGNDKEEFEQTVANDFGYEAAIFMPSGVMAQLIAMRIVCDDSGCDSFAMHPTCHVEKHEELSYSQLHNLKSCLLGSEHKMPLATDIENIQAQVSAVIYELPMRHLGGALPSWSELEKIKAICRERNIHLHIDGARLWETQSFYKRSLSDITQGAKSCYVSFYKGIGSTSGAMLMGSSSFIEKAKPWLRRHGGNLFQLSALWIPAKFYYDNALSCFDDYYCQAQKIAKVLSEIDYIEVTPFPLQTNMMHVLVKGDPDELVEKMKQLDSDLGYSCLLSSGGKDLLQPEKTRFELYVGKAAQDVSLDEIFTYFKRLTC